MSTSEKAAAVPAGNATTSGINFEKLTGVSNYSNWKFLMQMYLIHEDLWDCIEESISTAGTPKNVDTRKQQKALAKICLMVQPASFSHVRNASTGYQAWNNLKRAYEDRGLCRRLGLLRTLFGLKLEQFNDMEAYLLKICDLDQQLRDINAPLEDDFLGVLMLSGLSSDYDPLIMALENSNFKLDSETVKCKLLQENIRRDFDKCNENALYTNRFSKNENKRQSIATVKCFSCKKVGHYARNCPSKPNMTENNEKAWNGTLLTALAVNIKSDAWYVDSGATCHMTNNKSLLVNYVVDTPRLVTVANNQKMHVEGHGEVKLLLKGHKQTTTLSEVIFVPDLSTNLLSVNKITAKGLEVHFDVQKCNIYCGELVVASATQVNGVYELDTVTNVKELGVVCQTMEKGQPLSEAESAAEDQQTEAANFCEEKPTQEIWHRRLGHLNRRSMDLLKRGMASGIYYTDTSFTPCVACIEGKHFRLPFPKRSYTRATEKLGLIHSDLCGPMSVPSFSGAKYLLTFIDDFTRKIFVYFVKSKDEALEIFKVFKSYAENQTGLKIKMLRTDNGGEYVNKKFQAFLKDHGIEHQTTVPYSPQQNGVAERVNRTIMEATRSMLQDAGMEKQYWAEAANTAVFIKNRSPTKAVRGITPEEKWTGKKVDLSNMRVFGCIAYALIPHEKRKKLDAKSQRLIFVGYCTESKGYRLVDPSMPTKCIKSRDVQFLERKRYKDFYNEIKSNDDQAIHNLECDVEVHPINELEETDSPRSVIALSDSYSENDEHPSDVTWTPNMTSDSMSSSDGEYHESVAVATAAATGSDEPSTVQEALSGSERELWKAAITDEYQSFEKNKAWTLMPLPVGKKAVKCKWVFKKKYGTDGELLRYKARLVAKGFTQKYGIDYKETYSPVVRYSTIRTLLALAVNLDMQVDHMDVKTAFLNGDLTETVFMEQPEGYKVKGKENHVFKLNKAIYGLKQASRAWYEKIDKALIDLQFRRSLNEPCVYIKQDNTGELIILALYVDDILLISKNTPEKNKLKDELMKVFEMRDLGKATHVLGMRLRQDQGKISIDQKNYIQKVLEQFNMKDCKPASTPLEIGLKLEKGNQNDLHSQYRSLIGCIMYIAVCTRPDIAHAASILSQFNDCHSEAHWKAAKRVLRYLKGTMDYNLVYEYIKSELTVTGFVDADWASNFDRRSYTGYIFEIGGSAVSWESRKQRTVALSSTEAEYMAIADGTKEAMFLRSFLNECIGSFLFVTMYNDSQSAQKLCNSQLHHSRSKHIDVRHHFVREVVKDKIVNLEYMCTEQMPADVLTKPLCKDKHYNCLKNFGLKIIA